MLLNEDFWEQRYQQHQTGWDRGGPSPALLHWLDLDALPQGRALIPGCGRGHEVVHLAANGHAVTAADIAHTALDELRETLEARQAQARLIHADLLAWQPDEPFDLIYEQTCLCAIDPSAWSAYAARLASWVRPGGTLAVLFMQTQRDGGPPFHCPMDQMRQLFGLEHWHWQDDQAALRVTHPNGHHELGYLLQRRI